MNANQLIFLANSNPEIGDALVKIADAMEKLAVENPSAFNETVPATQVQPQQNQANGVQVYGQAQPGQPAAAPQQAVAAAPVEEQQPAVAAVDDSIVAAQQFMGPVFAAAEQGSEGAQSTLAQAAAAIVRSVRNANADNQAVADEIAAQSQVQPTDYSGVIDPAQQAQAQQYYDQQFGNGVAAPAEAAAVPAQTTVGTEPVPTGAATAEQAVADKIVPAEAAAAKPKKKEEPPKKK